jgi:hypothetical protein
MRPSRRAAKGALWLCLALALGPAATSAVAAGPPQIGDTWASGVETRSARLSAEIDPNGAFTTSYIEYASKAAYEANGFIGAKRINATIGSGTGPVTIFFSPLSGLEPDTLYRYRLTVTNSFGTTLGAVGFFVTQPVAGGALLPDSRGWEMVSPIDKNGGKVDPPGAIAGGGVLQAAAGGGAITYGSSASFGGGEGAPPASQYLATRAAGGWATQNLTVPIFSGSYDTVAGGVPYRLFSGDLARGLLLNGKSCRGEVSSGCPVANPTLPGTDAPAGYQNYYLRNGAGFEALLGAGDVSGLGLDPAEFELSFAGASADLSHVVLSTCAALSVGAQDGCPGEENLYRWSAGGGLTLINATPGAALAAPGGAVSEDGTRVYFKDLASGDLYLREGAALKAVDAAAGGGGTFQLATASGSLAYFTAAGHIWRYNPTANTATDLTPTGGVTGVLGAAADGSHLYYLSASGLYLCANANLAASCETSAVKVAAAADASNYPPATGTSRVSADGTKLLFLATAPLTGYDNTDLQSGAPDSQVYYYDAAGPATLSCVSCNPTNARPLGPSVIPGSVPNGTGPSATNSYKPRVLVAGGRRLFFESADALALTDTNSAAPDVYQWEAPGVGDCTRSGGCLGLISSGRDAAGAAFADASADGGDAYFLTAASLVAGDPGSIDLYDARIGGGFPGPVDPIGCEGDACQILPPEPTDPTLTTLLSGPGNPAVNYTPYKHHFAQHKKQKRCKAKKGKRSCAAKRERRHGSGR